jgi:ATP/maltotriose-dependent transcriptional regulator MalT
MLHRPRLDTLLGRLTDYALVLLRAEAGYGKTTAIASYLSQSGLPHFWYNLSDSDADPLIFVLHLIHAFRAAHPTVGERALTLLAQEGGATRLWAPAVDALANDLLDVLSTDAETVLVLDDYCLVNHPEINAIVERFIEHAPPRLHLVITARSMPSLPGRARWRASGELLEIGRAELAFTPDEVAALFAQRARERLPPEAAHALAAETEGWPIAVQMLSEGVSNGLAHTLDDLLRRMPGPSELLFNYLAEEVFDRQSPEVQTFLAETATLRRLDPEACNYLLGRTDSESVLRYLDEHSLFVAREGAYRYHHLFRDFLLRRADPSASQPVVARSGQALPPERRRALRGKAAAYYRAQGDYEEAIYYLLAAGDYASAADLLAMIARPMAYSGRHHILAACSTNCRTPCSTPILTC